MELDFSKKIDACLTILFVAAYLVMGFCFKLWHPGWTIFVLFFCSLTLVEAIRFKNIKKFDKGEKDGQFSVLFLIQRVHGWGILALRGYIRPRFLRGNRALLPWRKRLPLDSPYPSMRAKFFSRR